MSSQLDHIRGSAKRWAALAAAASLWAGCSAAGDPSSVNSGSGGNGGSGANGSDAAISLDGGNNGEAMNCASKTYGATRVPASVLLLLDRSASMQDCPSDASCTDNKWVGARTAIEGALSAAPPELRVGLVLFPAAVYDGYDQCRTCMTQAMLKDAVPSGCEDLLADCGCHDVTSSPDVEVKELSYSLPLIKTKLSSSEPDFNTPTYHALAAAYQIMTDLPTDGDRFVLLMTDGDPTVLSPSIRYTCLRRASTMSRRCTTNASRPTTFSPRRRRQRRRARPYALSWWDRPGYWTPSSFPTSRWPGATPKNPGCETVDGCHYQIGQTDFATELQAVLTDIAGQVATCTFALPIDSDEVDPNKVNVGYQIGDGAMQQLYMDPAHADGWDYTDDSCTAVEIYGPACEEIKKNTQSSVTIALGCVTMVK